VKYDSGMSTRGLTGTGFPEPRLFEIGSCRSAPVGKRVGREGDIHHYELEVGSFAYRVEVGVLLEDLAVE
jgi:hypothetical protein